MVISTLPQFPFNPDDASFHFDRTTASADTPVTIVILFFSMFFIGLFNPFVVIAIFDLLLSPFVIASVSLGSGWMLLSLFRCIVYMYRS